MLAVKNFFLPGDRKSVQEPPRFSRMPETLMRSLRRRSLRVKRTKSLVLHEKRKSGEFFKRKIENWELNWIKREFLNELDLQRIT